MENWNQAKEIFYEALHKTPDEREQYLKEACGNNRQLLSDVRILLNSYTDDFLEQPVLDFHIEEESQQIGYEPRFQKGNQINHYTILETLGRGGMGEVYLARDQKLDRLVAVKVLHKDAGQQAEKRLLREARSAAKLSHPNICSIYEVGETEEFPFIVMQFIEGETLDKLIKRNALTVNQSIEIARQIAEALEEAHSHHIIHRDIKPSNIIIDSKKQVMVLDFSLAKKVIFDPNGQTETNLSDVGLIAGTIAYMSPEQARGKEIDARTDIWSLGVVLYEMLSGQLPFSGDSKSDIIASILTKEPIPINEINATFPPEFNETLFRALNKNKEERYSSISQFSADLARLDKFDQHFAQINPAVIHKRTSPQTVQANLISNDSDQYSTYSEPVQPTEETKRGASNSELKFNLGWKWLVPAFLILFALFGSGFWKYFSNEPTKVGAFSAGSREDLKLTSLFNLKRTQNSVLHSLNFSPDGKIISFVLRTINSNDIYIKQVDQGEPKKITDGKGFYQTPVWSPDGQKIAFVSTIDGKTGIWSIPYLGGVPKLETDIELSLSNYQLKKWSNDGKSIFFDNTKGRLSFIELETGKTTEIELPETETKRDFNISRDEKFVSFASNNNSIRQISVYSFETKKLLTLSGENKYYFPYFFPDNQRIAFSSDQSGDNQIFVANLADQKPIQITFGDSNGREPIVSPDGKQIIYLTTTDESNIFSFNTENNLETQITNNTNLQLMPAVSADNSKIAYTAIKNIQTFNLSPLQIKSLNDENTAVQVSDKGILPVWSPKNDSIFFTKIVGSHNQIWKANATSLKQTQLTDDVLLDRYYFMPFYFSSAPFELSPDGTQLVYNSSRTGFDNIWTLDENGENPQMLTNNNDSKIRFSSPLYSPNGNQIAFITSTQIENNQVQSSVSLFTDGQIQTLFQTNSSIKILGWSNNGETLIFAVEKSNSVEILQIPTANNSQPKSILSVQDANINSFSLTPDGNSIAFSALQNEIDNLYLFRIGGTKKQISNNSDKYIYFSGLKWANDNKTIFYSKQSGGNKITMISDPK